MSPPTQSTVDPSVPPLDPYFPIDGSRPNSENLKAVIQKMNLMEHPEGGYFIETDRDPTRVPNPFPSTSRHNSACDVSTESRSACTTIHYLNKARTVHTLHRGRGRYIIIHADEVGSTSNPGGYGADGNEEESRKWTGKARVETFVVGHDVLKGERLQWIVEGGKYKCSYLLPDEVGGSTSEGLLISETVIPGFEYTDHDFMKEDRMTTLVTKEQAREMAWMLRKAD